MVYPGGFKGLQNLGSHYMIKILDDWATDDEVSSFGFIIEMYIEIYICIYKYFVLTLVYNGAVY